MQRLTGAGAYHIYFNECQELYMHFHAGLQFLLYWLIMPGGYFHLKEVKDLSLSTTAFSLRRRLGASTLSD